jgi:hypothetical protein
MGVFAYLWRARTRAEHLTWASTLGTRALPPRGPVLPYWSRARPGIFGGGVNDGRADRISKVGQYPAHVRPGGVAGIGCGRPLAQRRARPGPGRQWDNEMQQDSAGLDGT